jgi:hypothetical protein
VQHRNTIDRSSFPASPFLTFRRKSNHLPSHDGELTDPPLKASTNATVDRLEYRLCRAQLLLIGWEADNCVEMMAKEQELFKQIVDEAKHRHPALTHLVKKRNVHPKKSIEAHSLPAADVHATV